MATFEPIPISEASRIGAYNSHQPAHIHVEESQAKHRIEMVNFWKIAPGSRVLEIGCGQGTATVVFAEAVGPTGHVDAVDPGSPDYGSPLTLSQAQGHISQGPVGSRITWHNAMPTDFLEKNKDEKWDYVIMAHCIWYYSSLDELTRMLAALKGRATNFLVAEWALKASEPAAVPHLLAAITRASIEAHSPDSSANIRCLASPTNIKDSAKASGWTLQEETTVVPNEGLLDGHWEYIMIKDKEFVEDVDKNVKEERVKVMLKSSRETVLAAFETSGAKRVRPMDVWFAKFN